MLEYLLELHEKALKLAKRWLDDPVSRDALAWIAYSDYAAIQELSLEETDTAVEDLAHNRAWAVMRPYNPRLTTPCPAIPEELTPMLRKLSGDGVIIGAAGYPKGLVLSGGLHLTRRESIKWLQRKRDEACARIEAARSEDDD